MALTPLYRAQAYGMAGAESLEINPQAPLLITGEFPALFDTHEYVAFSQDIPALTPVAFSSGKIVPATSGTPAIGILIDAIETDADDNVSVGVYRGGVFNPAALNWPASYDTDEKKRKAFEGAASPTQIVIREPRTMTVE